MKRHVQVVPIHNSGSDVVQVQVEPEGDCFDVAPGAQCEVRLFVDGPRKVELEVEGQRLIVHCEAPNEVWIAGERMTRKPLARA